jgi:hypothetical protein
VYVEYGFIGRILEPAGYHREQILLQEPHLEAKLAQAEALLTNLPMPGLQPLLSGTLQASDFVRQFASLPREERIQLHNRARLDVSSRKPSLRGEEFEIETAKVAKRLLHKEFKERQRIFEYAVLAKSIDFHVKLQTLADRHILLATLLTILALAAVAISLLLKPVDESWNLLYPMSNLAFASVLLLFPTLTFTAYGVMMRGTHRRQAAIERRLVRLSAAARVFLMLDHIRAARDRKPLAGQERETLTLAERDQLEAERLRSDLEFEQRKRLVQLERKRVKDLLKLAEELKLSSEERLRLLEIVLKYPPRNPHPQSDAATSAHPSTSGTTRPEQSR